MGDFVFVLHLAPSNFIELEKHRQMAVLLVFWWMDFEILQIVWQRNLAVFFFKGFDIFAQKIYNLTATSTAFVFSNIKELVMQIVIDL